ncbi:FCD domain-containing protein [Pectobacteriaceae bacterium CE70]|uniref:Transcriptional regulator n=1 Tax=Serratia sp. (strain ATCC 39006) TaxID=104623 RepID=A0A2I5TH75_SERS3|nr:MULTISPECIES: FCD domain-containing protein [Enterobacterales]WJV61855.1 FCD domain-containing protein [Pectobacteriaceae bacterium C52]WJV66126.1 FCD domain-containing protein [Pectobacteriaceae bacterium CE70]WJY10139.1 FCD domain-containing protein [Pectobacteriaceae bacterium C80]AUG99569.1 transcriptional regulator [Serratia sp. ATCC 39006]AUH03887.1 transcriptional regulator [Serratia sp. ATCC 39006]
MTKVVVLQERKQYQEIGGDLREKIRQGKYPIGSRLPPERNIAETYGVSRTIVREALLMLELEGTVDIRQGSGVYVLCIPSDEDASSGVQNRIGAFEMLQARQLLESNIAAFAARMATRADIENLRHTLEQEQAAVAKNDYCSDFDKMFHLQIAGATQNQMLLETVSNIWSCRDESPIWQQLYIHVGTQGYRLKWLADHQLILAALRRRDVTGAYQTMWQHLENVKKTLMEISDADAPEFDGYLFDSVPIFQGKLV